MRSKDGVSVVFHVPGKGGVDKSWVEMGKSAGAKARKEAKQVSGVAVLESKWASKMERRGYPTKSATSDANCEFAGEEKSKAAGCFPLNGIFVEISEFALAEMSLRANDIPSSRRSVQR